MLQKYGPAVFERICQKALGKPVFYETDDEGRRIKRPTSPEDELACQKMVAERMVATLKAQELTGKDGQPLHPGPTYARSFDDWRLLAGGTREEYEKYLDGVVKQATAKGTGLSWHGFGDGDGSPFDTESADDESGAEADTAAADRVTAGAEREGAASLPWSPPQPTIGQVETVEHPDYPGRRLEMVLDRIEGDGRDFWTIFDPTGTPQSTVPGRDRATARALKLIETNTYNWPPADPAAENKDDTP